MRKKQKQRSYSAEFKQEAVRRMAQAKTITGLAEELGIRRKFLYQWRHQFEAEGRAGLERRRGRPGASHRTYPRQDRVQLNAHPASP
jgi:transposase-like protein